MKYLKSLLVVISLLCISSGANAQFYQIGRQLPSLISPALSGSFNYKGFVEASYVYGVGSKKVDFIGIATSQGFRYSSWLYMGVGLGVEYAISHVSKDFGLGYRPGNYYWDKGYNTRAFMIPVFTDIRFTVGNLSSVALYINARIGASFLASNKYLAVSDGFITNKEYFYLRPQIGARIPVGNSGNKAINVGATYMLLTSNYWFNDPFDATISAVGATVSFEW